MVPNLVLQIFNLLYKSNKWVAFFFFFDDQLMQFLLLAYPKQGLRNTKEDNNGIFPVATRVVSQLISLSQAMILQTVVLVLTIVLASVDSSLWSVAFFYITMVCVVVLNMAAGIYQNLSWATAANLPMKYSNAVMIGTNAVG